MLRRLATWLGIEAIARLSQLIGIVILVTSIVLFICSLPYFQIQNLLPQLEDGIMPPLRGAIYPGSWFGICITVAFSSLIWPIRKKSFSDEKPGCDAGRLYHDHIFNV